MSEASTPGPITAGYVFENDGKLVAGLRVITGEKGPSVSFQANELRDYLGNKVEGMSAPLQSFPLYAVGLKKAIPSMRRPPTGSSQTTQLLHPRTIPWRSP